MAHELTDSDQMFSVREATWHGLGHILPDNPTREEAQKLVHPWEPIEEPVYVSDVGFEDNGTELVPVTTYVEAPDHKAIRRSDNGDLLGVVGDGYAPVTNDELWDIAEALQGNAADVQYETGGSLQGGKKVWVLLKLDEPIGVKGDPRGATIPYYTLQNAHDGSGAFRGQATMTRIVCMNTSKMADLDARNRGTEFTFRHTKNVGERVEEARAALTGWRESLAEWKQLMELDLIPRKVDASGVEDFLDAFIPEPRAKIVSDRVRRNIADERGKWLEVFHSVTGEGIEDTAYGLVAASIEYAEHVKRAHTAETRFRRTYLDRNGLVAQAVRIAREVAPL